MTRKKISKQADLATKEASGTPVSWLLDASTGLAARRSATGWIWDV